MLTVESQILGHRHANSKSGRNCDVLFVRLVNIENADLVLLISGLYSEVTAKWGSTIYRSAKFMGGLSLTYRKCTRSMPIQHASGQKWTLILETKISLMDQRKACVHKQWAVPWQLLCWMPWTRKTKRSAISRYVQGLVIMNLMVWYIMQGDSIYCIWYSDNDIVLLTYTSRCQSLYNIPWDLSTNIAACHLFWLKSLRMADPTAPSLF